MSLKTWKVSRVLVYEVQKGWDTEPVKFLYDRNFVELYVHSDFPDSRVISFSYLSRKYGHKNPTITDDLVVGIECGLRWVLSMRM